jgi:hypothetical protein
MCLTGCMLARSSRLQQFVINSWGTNLRGLVRAESAGADFRGGGDITLLFSKIVLFPWVEMLILSIYILERPLEFLFFLFVSPLDSRYQL